MLNTARDASGGSTQQIGLLFAGLTVNLILYGVFATHATTYFRSYPTDRLQLRALVTTIAILSTTQQFLLVMIHFLVDSSIVVLVQMYYAFRVWHLSRRLLGAGCGVTAARTMEPAMAFAAFGLSLVIVGKNIRSRRIDASEALPLFLGMSGLIAAADMVSAGLMGGILMFSRSYTSRTRTIFRNLLLLQFITALLTSGWALLVLLTGISVPNTELHHILYLIGPAIYSSAFVYSLNTRIEAREDLAALEDFTSGAYASDVLPAQGVCSHGSFIVRSITLDSSAVEANVRAHRVHPERVLRASRRTV
ncbi:hypothetical protein BV20DRAFT_1058320 [Pilatotrama ljubarskyi]|nr:hypothetical protein BV20DRAFT_1058320 [Pilatotrama ljubarskyi]